MSGSLNARGRRTVAAIERAALAAADELPFARITVREICERASVSERVFFNHFATREDAFLGRDQPSVDEDWAQRYTTRDDLPLIRGAARLVVLDPVPHAVQERRQRLITDHPELLARAYAVLTPLRERCRNIVATAVRRRHPELTTSQIEQLARIVVAAASELVGTTTDDIVPVLSALRADIL